MDKTEEVVEKLKKRYSGGIDQKDEAAVRKKFIEFLGDVVFNNGILKTAKSAARNGNDVYLYSFDYCNPNGYGPLGNLLDFKGEDALHLNLKGSPFFSIKSWKRFPLCDGRRRIRKVSADRSWQGNDGVDGDTLLELCKIWVNANEISIKPADVIVSGPRIPPEWSESGKSLIQNSIQIDFLKSIIRWAICRKTTKTED